MKKLATISIFILINVICTSQIIHVPADYSTIQSGINAATNGDTVLVEQGIYFENINFMGKAIIVASLYIFESDSAHITNTIINGSQPANPDIGSVVSFDSNTDTTSCLLGFTITGGTGTKPIFIFPVKTGGGIAFTSAGGKLESNIIESNSCILDIQDGSIFGGGIGSGPPLEDHLIIIRNNIIRNNIAWTKGPSSAWNMGWAEGGGIYLCYNAIVEGNQISSNFCKSNNRISGGGGIRMIADPQSETYQILVELRDNLIMDNESKSESFGAFAGGISCSAANTIIENNIITGNSVESQNYCKGAGLYFDLRNTYYAKVNNNHISNNFSINGSSDGGAIGLFQSIDIAICNNLILNNSAENGNGGAFSISASQPELISNNTIINNTASEEGGSFYIFESSDVEISNSLLRNNSANGVHNEVYFQSGSSFSIQYSNIEDGYLGTGNINEDPLFVDSGEHPYALQDDSPCVNNGTPDITGLNLPEYDLAYSTRVYGGRIDMGAYENQNVIVSSKEIEIQSFAIDFQCIPNPVKLDANFKFELSEPVFVNLSIYDISGKHLETILSEKLIKGCYNFNWEMKNYKVGIYFCTIRTNNEYETIKFVKL